MPRPALCLRKRHTGGHPFRQAEGAILQRSGNTCVGSIALGEPLTPADPEISLRIYYAQAGEELFAIARRFHVSPAQMLAANDLAEGTTAIDALGGFWCREQGLIYLILCFTEEQFNVKV